MSQIAEVVQHFSPLFTAPTFRVFSHLLLAWTVATPARPTLTNLLRVPVRWPGIKVAHWSRFYRLFSRVNWSVDTVAIILANLVRPWLGARIRVFIDDTLCRRTGAHVLGAGLHHDPLQSTRGGPKRKAVTVTSWGQNFVFLSVWVPMKCLSRGGFSLPLLVRLYRNPGRCPESEYKTRTELAAQLLAKVAEIFTDKHIKLVTDSEYACKNLLLPLPSNVDMSGPLPRDAALYGPKTPPTPGKRGPKPQWGPRLPRPFDVYVNPATIWQTLVVDLYGRKITLQVTSYLAFWKSAGPARQVRVLITRDPTGKWKPAYYFHTDLDASIEQVLGDIALRWSLEEAFKQLKQVLHIEQFQVGFVRSVTKAKNGKKTNAGRHPSDACKCMVMAMACYGTVMVWYLRHQDRATKDLLNARLGAPWYRHKHHVSVADIFGAWKQQAHAEGFMQTPMSSASPEFLTPEIVDDLACAA